MKDIYDILKASGIELAEDFDKKAFEKELFNNYKTVAEFEKKDNFVKELQDKLNTATDGLKKFEGVNVDELKGEIAKLNKSLTDKDTEWQGKIAGMEFEHIIESAITSAKGKNAKAIKALLDIDTLKASTNRDVDVKNALEALKKDNDYLFETEPNPSRYASGAGKGLMDGEHLDPAISAFIKGAGLKTKQD